MASYECCVPMCTSTSTDSKHLRFFSVPNNAAVRKIWAKVISRRDDNGDLWVPKSDSSKICSLHFLESDFRVWSKHRRLVPNAVPSVFPGYPAVLKNRQAKYIASFRKHHPLGVSTAQIAKHKTSQNQENGQNGTSHECSKNEGDPGNNTANSALETTSRRTGEFENHSEDNEPLKKQKIETRSVHELFEPDSESGCNESAESKLLENSRNGLSRQTDESLLDESSEKIGTIRTRRSNSRQSKDVDKSHQDEDYVSGRPSTNHLENGESQEFMLKRQIKRLEQQIKIRDKQLINVNQNAVKEKVARKKAEKELEDLQNLMKQTGQTPEPSRTASTCSMRDSRNESPPVMTQNEYEQTADGSSSNTVVRNWSEQVRNLLLEVANEDRRSAKEKSQQRLPIEEKSQRLPILKNKFILILKNIFEDAMENNKKALFLLEQIENYGKEDVTCFRTSTIKRCVEWKLLNSMMYESVRNLDILTLPSVQILREQVDVIAAIGVNDAEELRLDDDIRQFMEELSGNERTQELNPKSNTTKDKKPPPCRTVIVKKIDKGISEDAIHKVIGKCRKQVKKEMVEEASSDAETRHAERVVEVVSKQFNVGDIIRANRTGKLKKQRLQEPTAEDFTAGFVGIVGEVKRHIKAELSLDGRRRPFKEEPDPTSESIVIDDVSDVDEVTEPPLLEIEP